MLNNASDYKFLDVSHVAGEIHGDIMPIVYPTANTIASAQYEDMLFLTEAYYERMNISSGGSNDKAIPSRRLTATNLSAISLAGTSTVQIHGPSIGYFGEQFYYLNPNTTYPSNIISVNQNLGDVYTYLQNYELVAAENKEPYRSMRPPAFSSTYFFSRLLGEFIRAKYWTFNQMNKALIRLCLGDFATQVTQVNYNSDGSIAGTSDVNLRNTGVDYVYMYSKGYDQQGDGFWYQAVGINANYKNYILTCPYATSAVVVFSAYVTPKSDYGGNDTYRLWTTIDANVTNGNIVVPADAINAMANTARNLVSGDHPTIGIGNFYLLIDFDFPASFNWNWQPSYTS